MTIFFHPCEKMLFYLGYLGKISHFLVVSTYYLGKLKNIF